MNKLLLHFVVLGLCLFLSGASRAGEQPNIVLLMGDDHGWDEVAYNGHPHLHTPVLDEMAATGLRLDRFYSGSSTCSPTRGSFLTGRHANRYGTFAPGWSIRPEEITLAQLLKGAGYRSAHFGKWHIGPVKKASPTSPGAMGFDEWLSHDNFFELNPVLSRNGADPERFEGESSEVLIDDTIRFIADSIERKQPFLAVVWFGSPHEPYQALEQDLALYQDLPLEYAKKSVTLTDIETGGKTTRPLRDVLQERYAEITAMDRAIGKLRDYLKDNGLRDNTIVFYCGDNGVPSSGNGATNPFRGAKGHVYEGGIRVPAVLEWPGFIPEPRASDLNTVTSDLLPTFGELAGQALPRRPLDGVSLVPLLKGEMKERSTPIFFWDYDSKTEQAVDREPYIPPELQEGTTPLVKKKKGAFTRTFINLRHPVIAESDYAGPRAVLENQYKLVINGDEEAGVELFDIVQDPYETTDLSGRFPELISELQDKMRSWQDSVLNSLAGADYQ